MFSGMAGKFREYRKYRETVKELGRLSDRELSDIGLSRGDIPFVARPQR